MCKTLINSFGCRFRARNIVVLSVLFLALCYLVGPGPASGATTAGTVKWQYLPGRAIYSSVAIGSDGTLYVGLAKNTFVDLKAGLCAINPLTIWPFLSEDNIKWTSFMGDDVESSPAIGSDGTIYVGSNDYNLYALNPGNGSKKWTFTTEGAIHSSPAIGSDGTIYIGSRDNNLYAVKASDGSKLWSFATLGPINSSPAIGPDGVIYVGSGDKKLYAVNPSDGTKKWAYTMEGVVDSSPAIGLYGTIYVGSNDKSLYAISPEGALLWSYPTGGAITSSPAIGADGTIYVGSNDKSLYAISPEGALLWSYPTGGAITSSPAIGADGTIYVGSRDNILYAIDPVDGTLVWSYNAGGAIAASPAISSSGTIYVGTLGLILHAVYSSSGTLEDSYWPMFRHDLKHTALEPASIDLTETSVSIEAGKTVTWANNTFQAGDTAKNVGNTASGAFAVRYYLSLTTTKDKNSKLLGGSRQITSLNPGISSTGTATVRTPANIAEGMYYLIACADGGGAVTESVETNNCITSSTTIEVAKADLVVSSLTDPPAAPVSGRAFSVTDTVKNNGAAPAGISTTGYYFSTITTKDKTAIALKGARSVPALNPGAESAGTVSVTIPIGIRPGEYYLLACADDKKKIKEKSKSNNCTASAGKTTMAKPDLIETTVTAGKTVMTPGTTLKLSDTVKNQGATMSGLSATGYYLSSTATKDAASVLLKRRQVKKLNPEASSSGSVTAKIPSSTALGDYYIIACADDQAKVDESDEANNCMASSMITVTRPNLIEVSVSDPPATIAPKGSFSVTDTAQNIGALRQAVSVTQYYLSPSGVKDASSYLLSGKRNVPALDAGMTSTGTVTVKLTAAVTDGTYYLLACADNTRKGTETSEDDNCVASTGTVTVASSTP